MTLIRIFSSEPGEDTLARRFNVGRTKAYEIAGKVGVYDLDGAIRVDAEDAERFARGCRRFGSKREAAAASALRLVSRVGGSAVLTRKRRG